MLKSTPMIGTMLSWFLNTKSKKVQQRLAVQLPTSNLPLYLFFSSRMNKVTFPLLSSDFASASLSKNYVLPTTFTFFASFLSVSRISITSVFIARGLCDLKISDVNSNGLKLYIPFLKVPKSFDMTNYQVFPISNSLSRSLSSRSLKLSSENWTLELNFILFSSSSYLTGQHFILISNLSVDSSTLMGLTGLCWSIVYARIQFISKVTQVFTSAWEIEVATTFSLID